MKWAIPGKAAVLVGGAFGSEGKGAAAAWLARHSNHYIDIATSNAGANAGHTSIVDGKKRVCFHLPTSGVVLSPNPLSYINSGSIIDIGVLGDEIRDCGLSRTDVVVDPRASVITEAMKAIEQIPESGPARIASTMHGVGAAIADKIMRRAPLVQGTVMPDWLRVDRIDLNTKMYSHHRSIVVEVPQGLGLSINRGLSFPFCTSRDCTVTAGLSDAGIHPSFLGEICMVIRTNPIRVGSSFNEEGELLGTSGPFWPDSRELDWAVDFPDLAPERTTVTKRVRRIATWSDMQYQDGLRVNRPTIVYLNFCNYLPSTPGRNSISSAFEAHIARMREIENTVFAAWHPRLLFGFGPTIEETTDNYDAACSWYERRAPTW